MQGQIPIETLLEDVTLGLLMRQLRRAHKANQSKVAGAMSINRRKVGEFERGKRRPSEDELKRFCEAMKLTETEWIALSTAYVNAVKRSLLLVGPEESIQAEKTYFSYRTKPVPLMESPELISHLESRYRRRAFRLGDTAFPVAVVWKNEDRIVDPDSILGEFDRTDPAYLSRSAVLGPSEYTTARKFIKDQYEAGPITYEGIDYRMTGIDISTDPARIHGAYGYYYDNILTQYAIEWELKKALLKGGRNAIDTLKTLGTLPLREAVEAQGDPILEGGGRCAAITISTLLVFKRRNGRFYCLMRRRSMDVGVSPGMLHVVPAGMFEMKNREDAWSVEMNVWRELLEEVYDEEEQQGTGTPKFEDSIRRKAPIALLIEMIQQGSAEHSVTGICCDLLNLRPEICTVLFAPDPAFFEARDMELNWEYIKEGPEGVFAPRWENIDEMIEAEANRGGIVASGAACLGLGHDWVRRRHGI